MPANSSSAVIQPLTPGMRRVRRIHFIGIGGSGMCGIAEVLLNMGYSISGSDLQDSSALQRLKALGAQVSVGHDGRHLDDADVTVVSSAIDSDNPELLAARQQRIPVVPRAEMLSEIMRFRHGIAIAGTHGKTTTTSLIASVLAEGGLDPTYVVGGRLSSSGTNARLGESRILVVEADESDASLLHLQPLVTVLTNLESDHLENYGGDFARLCATYIEFLHNLPFYGLAVLCIDDPVLRGLIDEVGRPLKTYGFSADADYRLRDYVAEDLGCRFTIDRPAQEPLQLQLAIGGKHNACNAAAAVAVAAEEGVEDEALVHALANFAGVDRRFKVHGPFAWGGGEVSLVDDYGHHPTEIAVTLEHIREIWPQRRVLMVFQPHRFSRLRDLYESFVAVLSQTEVLLLLDTYSAGEQPIAGVDSRSLCRSIRQAARVDPIFVPELESTVEMVMRLLQPGDIVLTQGAGNIVVATGQLLERLSAEVGS